MPRTKKNAKSAPPSAPAAPAMGNESGEEVLTLREAAAYLRLPEADVRRLVEEQGLPARQLEKEWRFLKSAIRAWLSTSPTKENQEGIWSAAGSWKDDPYLDEMLKEIYRRRGRLVTEE
ncbi:MAG TPA: helix-turn-helix domain-containing protein [Gemmataceae bacterium]|nr:helix-turn-helix domain-containing protein [Gemmataceae bacterium]